MNKSEMRKLMADADRMAEVKSLTSFLDYHYGEKINLRQRLWHIENNHYHICVCKQCNTEPVNWNTASHMYRQYCSSACAYKSNEWKEKIKQTNLERYGVASTLSDATTKEKIKQTNLERYGVENPFQAEVVKEKIKQTNIERYGVENPSYSDEILKKIDDTNLKKYGRKRKSQSHIPLDIISMKNDYDLMYDWHVDQKMPVTKMAEILNIGHSQLCIHLRDNLGIPVNRHMVSSTEKEVCEFLDSMSIEYVTSDRAILKPKEIDIYIPSANIAIEIDGLAWHTELKGKDSNYHLDKTERCAKEGIYMIHITDYEWNNKQEIVKSRIRSKLEKSDRVYARKCNIVSLNTKESEQFMVENHIQGNCPASIRYGLEYGGKIVAVMTFGKSRYNKQVSWELLRYASLLNTNVVGGASRLFKHFLRTDSESMSVVSYSDKRWNKGTVYEAIGFKYSHTSSPNYWYVNKNRTFESRVKYQKHKLNKILETFDPNKTEWENMKENGFDRYWDCGNDVWLYDK